MYHQEVEFVSVYIREAHPVDGWWFGKGLMGKLVTRGTNAAIDIYDPQTIEERRQAAGRCEDSLKYGIRTYVDDMDDAVNKAYAGWPTRLYLIGLDGKVVYHGGLGPWGFSPSKLKKAIADYLVKSEPVA
jgi:hypothetical protein